MTEYIALIILTGLVALWDLRYKKIPNLIVFPGMLTGICISVYKGSAVEILTGMAVLLLVSFFLFCLFRGRIGMGDLKLWMMCETFTGLLPSVGIFTLSQILLLLYVLLKGKSQRVWQGFKIFFLYKHLIDGTESYSVGVFFLVASFLYVGCSIGRIAW